MIKRLILSLIVIGCLTGFKTGFLGSVNIDYDFESIDMASGPDTFELFENISSVVAVNSNYAFRGARSLHLKDRADNNDFPEFQGYFPTVNGGVLEVGFALMTPTPSEPFNIALAGQAHFKMQKNGLGFWLFNDGGTLRHMSNSIPKKLFSLQPFQWYSINVSIDTRTGEYSLRVSNELGEQLVFLEQQKHPVNAAGSSLDKYSFSGDLNDTGAANFFIDAFFLRTDQADSPKPLIAPGRRDLFVDKWNHYYQQTQKIKYCLPPQLPYDFIDIYNTAALQTMQANSEILRLLLDSPSSSSLENFEHPEPLISGVAKWASGCSKLKQGEFAQAVSDLEDASELIGYSPAVQSGLAIAHANLGLFHAAQSIALRAQMNWPDDVRWQVLQAAIGFIAGRPEESEATLSNLANSIRLNKREASELMRSLGWFDQGAIAKLKFDQVWNEFAEDYIVAEQYYFSLLWQKRFDESLSFAGDVTEMLAQNDMVSPLWLERAADAAFFSKQYRSAERLYKRVLEESRHRVSALMKLSDVYFLQGQHDQERRIRESIYGALRYEQ